MRKILLDILVCPKCKGSLDCSEDKVVDEEIETGSLSCKVCSVAYPIIKFIPRFIESSNYTNSFGYQWNIYKQTQIDHYAKNTHSRDRFNTETSWDQSKITAKSWMLDAGCGNGRFLDISSATKAQVVGLDMSNAVDAAYELLKNRKNLHLVQANMFEPPFKEDTFDYVYSIGVIQHTPSPERTVKAIAKLVKKGGQIAVTIYENKTWTKLNAKYWARHLTKRIPDKALLNIIRVLSPILFPVTEVLYRIPGVGRFFKFVIPYANYVGFDTPLKNRYQLAILDTFDMLSPAYDQPQTEPDTRRYLTEMGITHIKRLPNDGLNLVGEKQ